MSYAEQSPVRFNGLVRAMEKPGGSGSAWVNIAENVGFTEAQVACEKHLLGSPDDGHLLQFQIEDENGERMAILNPPHVRWLTLQEPASEDSQIIRSTYNDIDLIRQKVNVAVFLAGIAASASLLTLIVVAMG